MLYVSRIQKKGRGIYSNAGNNVTIELMFADVNVFGLTQTHFYPSEASVKIELEKDEKHIYPQEHQLYYYHINFKEL